MDYSTLQRGHLRLAPLPEQVAECRQDYVALRERTMSQLPDAPRLVHRNRRAPGRLQAETPFPSLLSLWQLRLLAKVYELDVMACPNCGSRMSVIALILDPAEIRKIIACLSRHVRGPSTEA